MTTIRKGALKIENDGTVRGSGALFAVFNAYVATLPAPLPEGAGGVPAKRNLEGVVRAFCSMLDFIATTESTPAPPPSDGTTLAHGTYVGELLYWNGTAWVPALAGVVAATFVDSRPNDGNGKIALRSGAGIVGIESVPDVAEPYAVCRAPQNGDAFLIADNTSVDGHEAKVGVVFDATEHYGVRVGAASDELGGHDLALGFYDGPPTKQQAVQGSTAAEKIDSLITLLSESGCNLVANGSTPGDYTYSAPFTVSANTTLQTIPIPSGAIVHVEWYVSARDNGNNFFKARYENDYSNVSGSATVQDGGEPIYQHLITGVTGAPLVPSGSNVEAKIATTVSVHGYFRIKVTTTFLSAAP